MKHREEFVEWVTWVKCRDCALFETGATAGQAREHAEATGHRVRWAETRSTEYTWVGPDAYSDHG